MFFLLLVDFYINRLDYGCFIWLIDSSPFRVMNDWSYDRRYSADL